MKIWMTIIAALFLAACSTEPLPLPKLKAKDTVLLFGDGFVSRGTGDPLLSLPNQLAERSALNVIDGGKKAELAADGVNRLPGMLKEYQPKLLLLIHGGTDMYLKKNREGMKKHLARMVQLSREHNVPVVMFALPKIGFVVEPAEEYASVAKSEGAIIDNELFSQIFGKPIYLEDNVHPNHKGNTILANGIVNLLKKHGAL